VRVVHDQRYHADGDQRPQADFARACAGVLQQRRLSNARLTADHACPTPILDTIGKSR
jgi:hypothetical protein